MRADELGIAAGPFARGHWNAITDVVGVKVGHASVQGSELNTGVTAIVPEQLGPQRRALPAALFTGNGYGKLIGGTQLTELGELETPILLTNTLAAFRVADALAAHVLAAPGYEHVTSLNPVVGETNDGHLSNIRDREFGPKEALEALRGAAGGAVAEGCVGAGSGTIALGYKGGIGSASRVIDGAGAAVEGVSSAAEGVSSAVEGVSSAAEGVSGAADASVTIGALVQSNFGGVLTVKGVRCPAAELLDGEQPAEPVGNSCMIVVATDAAVDSRQLGRIARRALFAMGRVGASFAHGSGDYAIAFTTAAQRQLADSELDPLFAATQDAVEEALLNSLLTARTTTGYQGSIVHAVPLDKLAARLVTSRR